MIKNKFIGSKGESIFSSYTEKNGKLEIKVSDGKNTAVFEGEGTHQILTELCNFLTSFEKEINKTSQAPTKFSKKFMLMVNKELVTFLAKKLVTTEDWICNEYSKPIGSMLLKPHIINDCAKILGIEPNEVWE